jgi:prepilin peptidase CpaA
MLSAVIILGHWLLIGLLIAVVLYDLRYMRLPNALALAFVVVFALSVSWTLPMDDLAWRICIALAVLFVGVAANAAKLLGGGDVKILAAFMLFVPHDDILNFVFIFCVCMFVGIVALLILRRLLRARPTAWRGLDESGRYPMGISIGMAGLIVVF